MSVMALYTCLYFKSESGKLPAREFIDSLDARSQRKFFFVCGLLQELGHKLYFPYAKYVAGGIFELRFGGVEGNIRVLYFFFQYKQAIFTNGFIKKTSKIPANELKIAIERRKIFLQSKIMRGEYENRES